MNDHKVKGGEARDIGQTGKGWAEHMHSCKTICDKDVKEKKELPPTHTNYIGGRGGGVVIIH